MKKVMLFRQTIMVTFLNFFLFQTINAQFQFKTVVMGGGGFVSGIITCKTEQNLMYARTDVGGAYKWNASTSKWAPLLDWASANETGYMGAESIAIDPTEPYRMYMLVGTSYFNGGKTAILRSTNYGQTFTITDVTSQFKAHGNGMGRQNGEKLQVDPNNNNVLYCGTRYNGLWKSYDKGASWSNVGASTLNVTTTPNGNGISFVLVDAASKGTSTASQKIYVGVSRAGTTNLFVSTNAGSTFSAVSGAPTTYMPQRGVIGSDGRIFVTYGNGAGPHGTTSPDEPMSDGAVWRYTPSANTWANVTPSGYASAFSGISIDPNNAQRIVISTVNNYATQYTAASGSTVYGDRILLSTNGGTSWADPIANGMTFNSNGVTWVNGTNIHWVGCAEFDPFNTAKVWVTSGQGIFSCDNINAATTTWKFNVSGLEETVPRDIVSIPGGPLVSVIYDYDGFRHTDVSQYAPRHSPTMGTTTGIAYAGTEKQTLLRCGGSSGNNNRLFYSTNQGTSWTLCATNKGYAGKVAVSANGYAFLHCPAGSSTTWRSVDKGGNWTAITSFSTADAVPVADLVDAQKFYNYDNNTGIFWRSTDRGSTFTNVASIGTGGSKIIRAVPGYDGDVWVALNGGGLKYTTDGGTNFTTVTTVSNCSAVGLGKSSTTNGYPSVYIWGTVNGVQGLYRSTNTGGSWTRVNDDAHEYGGLGNGNFVCGSMNTYGRVFMSTVGRGIVYSEPTGTGTGNNRVAGEELMVDATAYNNKMSVYPNPVVTTSFAITITSDKQQTIQLSVTTIDGKLVAGKNVVLRAGENRIEMNEVVKGSAAMYILSAKTEDGKNFAEQIKFLKL